MITFLLMFILFLYILICFPLIIQKFIYEKMSKFVAFILLVSVPLILVFGIGISLIWQN